MKASKRIRRVLDRRAAVVLLIGASASAGAIGLSHAFAASPATVFHACLDDGRLRDVSTKHTPKCHDEGRAVSWDQTGPQGPQGAPGISGYEIVQNIQASYGNFTQLIVLCPTGKRAIGGGAEALGVNSILNGTTPTPSGDGWIAVGHQPGYGSVGLHVFAICAHVLP